LEFGNDNLRRIAATEIGAAEEVVAKVKVVSKAGKRPMTKGTVT
jgi:hypothetical protein